MAVFMCLKSAVPVQHSSGSVCCRDERLEWTGDAHSLAHACTRKHTHTHARTHTHTHVHIQVHTCVHMQDGSLQQKVTDISENVKPAKSDYHYVSEKDCRGFHFFPIMFSCLQHMNMHVHVSSCFVLCVCVCAFFYFWPKSFFSRTFTSSRWATHPDSLTRSFQIAPWKLPSSDCNYWRCWILFISHFTCVEDSGFPEVHHTAQFSWSSSPCTVILGERELPWTAQPWRDGHGDCQQQVSVCPEQCDLEQSWRLSAAGECPEQLDLDQSQRLSAAGECPEQLDLDQSRRLSAAGECSEQWDCDFEETHKETSQQVSICPEQCDLEQSWRLASRSVFVLSSVTLNSLGD